MGTLLQVVFDYLTFVLEAHEQAGVQILPSEGIIDWSVWRWSAEVRRAAPGRQRAHLRVVRTDQDAHERACPRLLPG